LGAYLISYVIFEIIFSGHEDYDFTSIVKWLIIKILLGVVILNVTITNSRNV